MITVDVYMPYLNAVYDFSVDETAIIEDVIDEMLSSICAKEHWKYKDERLLLELFDPKARLHLDFSKSLIDYQILSGHRLILC